MLAALIPVSVALGQDEPPAERKVRFTGFPYVFSTPEAGPAAGVGGIMTFYTSRTDPVLRPSKVTLSGWYSLNGQYKISLVPQVTFHGNRWEVGLPADYGRFTDRYWGVGNETQEFPDDTTTGAPSPKYRTAVTNVKLDVQFPSTFTFLTRTGIVLELNNTDILDVLTNPLIDSTLLGSEGGQTIGAGVSVVRDSRNHTFFPSAGTYVQARLLMYPLVFVADYQFLRAELDARKYFGRSPDEVLAVQLYGAFTAGSPPFYQLPALGGSNRMRGYFLGRYRDRHYVTAQAEYRRMVWWRLGFAVFAGAGEVFGSENSEIRLRNLKWSLGGGLRIAFNRAERVNLRVDVGVGRHTTGLYFQLEEAF